MKMHDAMVRVLAESGLLGERVLVVGRRLAEAGDRINQSFRRTLLAADVEMRRSADMRTAVRLMGAAHRKVYEASVRAEAGCRQMMVATGAEIRRKELEGEQ